MREDNGYSIAESTADFDGWEILLIEDWKPTIKRVHMRKISSTASFLMVYASDDIIPRSTTPPEPAAPAEGAPPEL